MSRTWLDTHAEQALQVAIARIESASAAEVAVAIRTAARPWPHVPLIIGIGVGWTTLAFLLFSEPAFALPAFLFDPLIAGAASAWVASRAPHAVRWLTPLSTRRTAAVQAARAAFVERGVHRTSGRTGVLVYCALAERIAVVVGDSGVETALPGDALAAWEDRLNQALPRGGAATADAVAAMTPILAAALPRGADDVNELDDLVEHDVKRRPRR
jgi:putative membrane protein